ncbi:TIGR03619 family F420-dependent LLM class oxidoreductase [Streptomyces sp. NPDC050504]|uniref:TIGR03619 family F420-dependent LLM class oxidoreductase n=1 Tax=Streptomyces sp. NPDC050504 TaxID=3365618 RepID=UPI0037878E5D
MDIGIALPQYGTHATPHHATRIAAFARDAEAAGFTSLWVGDRSLTPVAPSDLYPGHTAENPYPREFTTFLDPLAVLTVAATATTTARLGTSTLNAPWYPPLLLARSLTTLDNISGGRLDAGFGVGWMRDEYTSVNADFARRGADLDEILDFLGAIWTEETFAHDGPNWRVPSAHVGLRPVQQAGPPVYLGGLTPAAMRRVGRRADGWVGIALPPEAHRALWETARRAADGAGRDPDALRRQIRYNATPGQSAEEIGQLLLAIRDSGADGAFVDLQQAVREPDEALELGGKALDLFTAN